ncbi:MAG: hypothetical protein J5817_06745, partial [Treponema sp.]|nr:hypothetical protein [Treponema sp.]
KIYENEASQGGGIYVSSGTVKLILDSDSKDHDNSTAVGNGPLCYIASGVTILADSRINTNTYTVDSVVDATIKY